MKKKVLRALALSLGLMSAFSIAGCGKKKVDNSDKTLEILQTYKIRFFKQVKVGKTIKN